MTYFVNENPDIFDNNHVFVVNVGSETVYIPFRNVSYVLNNNGVAIAVMNNSDNIVINETDAYEFLQEYKGCVGLPLDKD